MLWAPGITGDVRAKPVPMETISPPGRSDWTFNSAGSGGNAKRRKLICSRFVRSGSSVLSDGFTRRTNSMALTSWSDLSTVAITITWRSTSMIEASRVVSYTVSSRFLSKASLESDSP